MTRWIFCQRQNMFSVMLGPGPRRMQSSGCLEGLVIITARRVISSVSGDSVADRSAQTNLSARNGCSTG